MKKAHVAALERAIEIAGSQSALAEGIAKFMGKPTVSQQLISKWLRKGTRVAAEYWPAIEHVTSQQVTRVNLRPDVFGRGQSAGVGFHVGT